MSNKTIENKFNILNIDTDDMDIIEPQKFKKGVKKLLKKSDKFQKIHLSKFTAKPAHATLFDSPYEEFKTQKKVSLKERDIKCTRPCKWVVKQVDEDGKVSPNYGICTRELCTFAHCLDELVIIDCAFGDRCNRKDGSIDYNSGVKDTSNKCTYLHPNENIDQYYERTGIEKPDIPRTNEKTRQPIIQSKSLLKEKKKEENIVEKSVDDFFDNIVAEPIKKGAWSQPLNIEKSSTIEKEIDDSELEINNKSIEAPNEEDVEDISKIQKEITEKEVYIKLPMCLAEHAFNLAKIVISQGYKPRIDFS
jgi:hypothetical protein